MSLAVSFAPSFLTFFVISPVLFSFFLFFPSVWFFVFFVPSFLPASHHASSSSSARSIHLSGTTPTCIVRSRSFRCLTRTLSFSSCLFLLFLIFPLSFLARKFRFVPHFSSVSFLSSLCPLSRSKLDLSRFPKKHLRTIFSR